MFGYVKINSETLSKEEKDRFQSQYCGLCRQLGERYGSGGRATLTYDMTFLAMLLGSLYSMEETDSTLRCPINPLRHCAYVITEATGYAADMNILLAYYKAIDDWQDDHSVTALGTMRLLEKKVDVAGVRDKWPRQSVAIIDGLTRLSDMEKANELNPDLPTNCFGKLMAELFILREDEHAPTLRRMGAALGRFIYMMDASLDLAADIRKERYNPLVAQTGIDLTQVLTMLIGECTEAFESLPIERDLNILRNILYSGVWVQYISKSMKEGQDKRDDGSV